MTRDISAKNCLSDIRLPVEAPCGIIFEKGNRGRLPRLPFSIRKLRTQGRFMTKLLRRFNNYFIVFDSDYR